MRATSRPNSVVNFEILQVYIFLFGRPKKAGYHTCAKGVELGGEWDTRVRATISREPSRTNAPAAGGGEASEKAKRVILTIFAA